MPVQVAMPEDLRQIDVSAVKRLARLKQEQDVIQGYLGRAAELKERFSDAAYQRVLQDYQGRHRALEEQVAPLRNDARREYGKLGALLGRLKGALEKATVDKQELEFRHAIGELSKEQVAERLKEAERAVGERQSALAEAEGLQQQFIAAFGSREALEEESETPATAYLDQTNLTAIGTPVETRAIEQTRAVESRPPETGPDKTFILPQAMLVTEKDGAPQQYPLGALNYIGRTPDNQIQLVAPGVSRRHAVVMVSATGFTLKDLESQNGTFVNDKRVGECALAEGDRIRIGGVVLLFRLS